MPSPQEPARVERALADQSIRVGVLGMGRWGRNLIRVFDRQAQVVTASNRGAEEARRWLRQEYPWIRPTLDPRDVIDDPSIDAVVIATPISTHADLAMAALRAGRDVFVEKPLATSSEEALLLGEAARAMGRRLFVGHTFMFDESIQWLDEHLDGDDLASVRTTWRKNGTFGEPLEWNLLPHELAITMSLFGTVPEEIEVQEAAAGQTELDRLRLALRFPRGTGHIEIDRQSTDRVRLVEPATMDGTVYRWSDGILDRMKGGTMERVMRSAAEPLEREVAAFLAALSGQVPRPASAPFATEVIEVIERVTTAIGRLLPASPYARTQS